MDRDFKRQSRRPYADIVTVRRHSPKAAQQPPVLISEAYHTPETQKKTRPSRKKLIIALVSVVIILAGVSVFFYAQRPATPLDDTATQVNFSLYYPSSMPEGYTLSRSSIKISNELVIYTLQDALRTSPVTITEQSMPASFDASKMVGKDASPAVIVPAGTLYNISTASQAKYMLTTPETLILINSPSKAAGEAISLLASRLEQIAR